MVGWGWPDALHSNLKSINIYCILNSDQSIKIKTLSPDSGAAADSDGSVPWMQTVNGGRHWIDKCYINIFWIDRFQFQFTFWDIEPIIFINNIEELCSDPSLMN